MTPIAIQILASLDEKGIDLDAITQKLENEGIEKFNKAYDEILETIKRKKIKETV